MRETVFCTELTRTIYRTSQGHRVLWIIKCVSTHRNDYLHGRAQRVKAILPLPNRRAAGGLVSEVFSQPLRNSWYQKQSCLQREKLKNQTTLFFFSSFWSYLRVFHNWEQGQHSRSDKLKLSYSLIFPKKGFHSVSVAQWVVLISLVFERWQGREGGGDISDGGVLYLFRRCFLRTFVIGLFFIG